VVVDSLWFKRSNFIFNQAPWNSDDSVIRSKITFDKLMSSNCVFLQASQNTILHHIHSISWYFFPDWIRLIVMVQWLNLWVKLVVVIAMVGKVVRIEILP
jgi:hypothetical protein